MNYDKYDLINGNDMKENFNIEQVRETFISKYCAKMGWNKEELTNEQLSKIKREKEYKNPGLMLS